MLFLSFRVLHTFIIFSTGSYLFIVRHIYIRGRNRRSMREIFMAQSCQSLSSQANYEGHYW